MRPVPEHANANQKTNFVLAWEGTIFDQNEFRNRLLATIGSGESPNPKVCPAIFSQVELLQMLDRVVELEAILDTCVRSEVIPPSIRNKYRAPVTPKQGQVISHPIPPLPFASRSKRRFVSLAARTLQTIMRSKN